MAWRTSAWQRVQQRLKGRSWRSLLLLMIPVALVLGVGIQRLSAPEAEVSSPTTGLIVESSPILGAHHVAAMSQSTALVVPTELPEGVQLVRTSSTSSAVLLDIYLPEEPLITVCTGNATVCRRAVDVGQLIAEGTAMGAPGSSEYLVLSNRRSDEDADIVTGLSYLQRKAILGIKFTVIGAATDPANRPSWLPQEIVDTQGAQAFAGTEFSGAQRLAASCGRQAKDAAHVIIACGDILRVHDAAVQGRWPDSPYLGAISSYAVNRVPEALSDAEGGAVVDADVSDADSTVQADVEPELEPAAEASEDAEPGAGDPTYEMRWLAMRPSPRNWSAEAYEFQRWQDAAGGWPCRSADAGVDRLTITVADAFVRLPEQSCARRATFWGSLRLPSLAVHMEASERGHEVLASHIVFPGPRFAPEKVPYFRPFVAADLCPDLAECERIQGEVWD